jgi:hypothetical protein
MRPDAWVGHPATIDRRAEAFTGGNRPARAAPTAPAMNAHTAARTGTRVDRDQSQMEWSR